MGILPLGTCDQLAHLPTPAGNGMHSEVHSQDQYPADQHGPEVPAQQLGDAPARAHTHVLPPSSTPPSPPAPREQHTCEQTTSNTSQHTGLKTTSSRCHARRTAAQPHHLGQGTAQQEAWEAHRGQHLANVVDRRWLQHSLDTNKQQTCHHFLHTTLSSLDMHTLAILRARTYSSVDTHIDNTTHDHKH